MNCENGACSIGFARQRVINLFGGPGSGKSTGAAYVFAKLKMHGINCELVQEYAKDKVWQNDLEVFNNQLYVIGKQSFRMSRLKGKVDVIITDSPIIMGSIYCKNTPYYEPFHETLNIVHKTYENFNYILKRCKPYNPAGRFQDEEGAKLIDVEIEELLKEKKTLEVAGDQCGYDFIVEDYLKRINWKE